MRPNVPTPPMASEQDERAAAAMGRMLMRTREELDKSREAIELRKWCVEQSVKLGATKVIETSQVILDWITAPLDKVLPR